MKIKKKFWNEICFIQANFKEIVKKSWENEIITIEGFWNTDFKDRDNDIVDVSCWTKEVMDKFMENPQMLYSHDMERSVWKWNSIEVRNEGWKNWIFLEWDVIYNIDIDWVSLFERIKTWTTKTLSIWFFPKVWKFFSEDWTVIADENWIIEPFTFEDLYKSWVYRIITELELIECSIVNIPSNSQATFAIKKSLELNRNFIFKNIYKIDESIINNKWLVVLDDATKEDMEKLDSVIEWEVVKPKEDEKPKDKEDGNDKEDIKDDKKENEDNKTPEEDKKDDKTDVNDDWKKDEEKKEEIDYDKIAQLVFEKIEAAKNKTKVDEETWKDWDENSQASKVDEDKSKENSGQDSNDKSKTKEDDSDTSQKDKQIEKLLLENKTLKEKLEKPVNVLKQQNVVETKTYDFKGNDKWEISFYFWKKD